MVKLKKVDEKASDRQKSSDFDTPWKKVFNIFFEEFIALFCPTIYRKIDWSKGYRSLDKELHKIMKGAAIGNRGVDKLIEATSVNGGKILFHIEVQRNRTKSFLERMLTYRCRLREMYKEQVISIAILIDDNKNWRPKSHREELEGCYLEVGFFTIKLLDYKNKVEDLKNSKNAFALIILAQLAAIEKFTPQLKLTSKIELIHLLYNRKLTKKKFFALFLFIDWVLPLPLELEMAYHKVIEEIEKKGGKHMAYVSSVERFALQRGEQIGIQKGEQIGIQKGEQIGIEKGQLQGECALLMRLLTRKYKIIPQNYIQKVELADAETLLEWGEKILDSKSLEEVFQD